MGLAAQQPADEKADGASRAQADIWQGIVQPTDGDDEHRYNLNADHTSHP